MPEENDNYLPVTHVIFDLDGLLIDSEFKFAKSIEIVLQRYGKDYPLELQEKVLGMEPAKGLQVMLDATKIPVTVQEFMVLEREVYKEEMKNLNFMPGAEKLVKHLHKHKVPIAIATGSTNESFAIKSAKFGDFFKPGNYFQHIVMTRDDPDVKHSKPHPDAYLVAANRFDPPAHPKSCLVFEDSGIGVDAGIAAGMQVIMVPDIRFKCKQKNATIILKSLEDFKPELFGLPPYD